MIVSIGVTISVVTRRVFIDYTRLVLRCRLRMVWWGARCGEVGVLATFWGQFKVARSLMLGCQAVFVG